jgi:ribonucleoside-diphosphate reductase alpha chain
MRHPSVSDKIKLTDQYGNTKSVYLTLCKNEGKLVSTPCTIGKAGSEERGMSQALGLSVSLHLKSGVSPERVARELRGIDCGLRGTYQGKAVTGLPDILAVALEGI